jgi:hypothetical protein
VSIAGPSRNRHDALVAAATKGEEVSEGFIRLRRSPILDDLQLDANAWKLLGIIARRARWNDGPNEHNLKIGEALVGDYKPMKFTREEYRQALRRLETKWHQITTRGTSRGTIATLIKSAVFDLSQPPNKCVTSKTQPSKQPPVFTGETAKEQPSKPPTNNHQTTIKQPLTNKEIRKEENDDDSKPVGSSLAGDQTSARESSSSDCVAPKEWKRFEKYCIELGGTPTPKGFRTWKKVAKPVFKERTATKMTYLQRETREPSDEEFAKVGKIAREAMAEFKAKCNAA